MMAWLLKKDQLEMKSYDSMGETIKVHALFEQSYDFGQKYIFSLSWDPVSHSSLAL